MTRRALASWAGAIVCIAWAVLTAWEYLHRREIALWDEPENGVQGADPRTVTLASGGEVRVLWN